MSSYVDMYNATNNSWTSDPAGLGIPRAALSAAVLPSGLVFFAGGGLTGEVHVSAMLSPAAAFAFVLLCIEDDGAESILQ